MKGHGASSRDPRIGDDAGIEARLAAAGWTVAPWVTNALVVVGTTFDVSHVTARRGPHRGWLAVLGACVDGDEVDRSAPLARGPAIAARRRGTTKLRAEVLDADRARDDLAHLAEPLFSAASFEQAIAAVAARGVVVDRAASAETVYDDFNWQIRGWRGDEHVDVALRLHYPKDDAAVGIGIDDRHHARVERRNGVAWVAVRSVRLAEALLDDVTGP